MTIDPFTWFTLKCVAFGLLWSVVAFLSLVGLFRHFGAGEQSPHGAEYFSWCVNQRVPTIDGKGLTEAQRSLLAEMGYQRDGRFWILPGRENEEKIAAGRNQFSIKVPPEAT